MKPEGSVTTWIGMLEKGDDAAAQRLWERYYARLIELAQAQMRGMAKRVADEEDVVLSAFHTLCTAAVAKRVPQLSNRDDLWRTLVLITAGKAVDERRRQNSQKRGGAPEAASNMKRRQRRDLSYLENVIGTEPDPSFAAQIQDEFQLLLSRLADDGLRAIALSKLEGFSNEEIAEQLNCSLRTITRRLTLIRRTWEASADFADN
jgi:RNA polymerase sigma factor (sigma-70 family)